eukprot:jgi/Chlat1/6322/Chrsp44S05894
MGEVVGEVALTPFSELAARYAEDSEELVGEEEEEEDDDDETEDDDEDDSGAVADDDVTDEEFRRRVIEAKEERLRLAKARQAAAATDEAELLDALDWMDLREDLVARGGSATSTSFKTGLSSRPNAGGGVNRTAGALQPHRNRQQQLNSREEVLDRQGAVRISDSVATSVRESSRKEAHGRMRTHEKSDRATVEQVLDPRTRMVLFKMLNRGIFTEINGCVSTGKEANVYHASTDHGEELAVKVYKTSILVFKDRDRYVQGDFRFRHGYSKHNPRKMVKTWAEKEMRNLMRLNAAGVRSPRPVLLRMHVLVMTFVGDSGWAAPRLKDAELTAAQLRESYVECILAARTMYQDCKLVHGDFSEYNVLYYQGHCHFIDVSQAVDLDHPHALEFLREDCQHVTDFFKKNGVGTMTVRELFDFVTDPTITNDNLDAYLDMMQRKIESRPAEPTHEESVAEAVFKQAYIPRTLEQVADFEKDAQRIAGGESEGIYYQTITGLKPDLSGVQETPALLEPVAELRRHNSSAAATAATDTEVGTIGQGSGTESVTGDEASDSESSNASDGSDASDGDENGVANGTEAGGLHSKEELKAMRKAHKKEVKAERREHRKTKVPKAVKKRKEKAAKDRASRRTKK